MPMVKITLPCGCVDVVSYHPKARWDTLPEPTRNTIKVEAIKAHTCRPKPPPPKQELPPAVKS